MSAQGSARARVVRRAIDGVLLADKPAGLTSSAVVQVAKRLFRAQRVGHTGTLDPLATGLLPLCLGEATKFSGLLLEADKTYEALIQLGRTTTTGDAEGETTSEQPVPTLEPLLPQALQSITGSIAQIPPMYSALKHQGRPLYEYARAGEDVERAARAITVHRVDVLEVGRDTVRLRLRVSKGTYVRALAQTLGEALGCGGYLAGLRRTGIGTVSLEAACTLSRLELADEAGRDGLLLPVDFLAGDLPRLGLEAQAAESVLMGRRLRAPLGARLGTTRLYGPGGGFLGLGEIGADGVLAPRRMLALAQVPEIEGC